MLITLPTKSNMQRDSFVIIRILEYFKDQYLLIKIVIRGTYKSVKKQFENYPYPKLKSLLNYNPQPISSNYMITNK